MVPRAILCISIGKCPYQRVHLNTFYCMLVEVLVLYDYYQLENADVKINTG